MESAEEDAWSSSARPETGKMEKGIWGPSSLALASRAEDASQPPCMRLVPRGATRVAGSGGVGSMWRVLW